MSNLVMLRYSVQAEDEVLYEVNLDGKLVSTGRALTKQVASEFRVHRHYR